MADRVTEAAAWGILAEPLTTPISELAKRWGVSPQTVRLYKRLAVQKAVWMHQWMVNHGAPIHLLPPAENARRGKLTDAQVREIRKSPVNSKKLAEDYPCSPSMVRMIKTGKAYTHVED